MCESQCDAYAINGRARFTVRKGHKVHVAEKIWYDCVFYKEFQLE